MLEPVGGMDRIAAAFAERLAAHIRYEAVVTEIRRAGDGARVVTRYRGSGATTATDAAFVIVTIPLPVLASIDADFAPRTRAAVASAKYLPGAKVGFHAHRRFWEEDHDIYGGISWTTQDITQIWYPSNAFQGADGVLVGGYIWTSGIGAFFAALSPEDRLRLAAAQGERLHPGYAAELSGGVAVAWSKVPFSEGAWCEWSPAERRQHLPVLTSWDGPFLFAGEHLSDLPGWQEGAVLSAHRAVRAVAERVASP